MGRILIRKVSYSGENYIFETPVLKGGINILEGKNGNGKSTFMNLIYYGLSGKVEEFTQSNKETHAQIIQDKNNYVRLDILINEKAYSLLRYFNSNDITVLFSDSSARVLPINRSKTEKYIFSDWILTELGIEPVEVFQGSHSSKINFKDLLRLIYHNQELNPKKVYKPSDSENFISDSELVRKIIFELLIGKTFSKYYSTFAEFKETEKNRNLAKALLDDYVSSLQTNNSEEDLNLVFLNKAKIEKQDQLNKLIVYRNSLRDQQRPKSQFYSQINEIKSQVLAAELSLNEKSRTYNEVIDELTKLRQLRENVILEVTQISKIIHSHEKLSLFAADTCPYCLRDVNREKGHCVCGSEISEEQYERFFYSSDEYTDILKSKQKSIDTIDIAIGACQEQAATISSDIDNLNSNIEEYKKQISNWIEKYDFSGNTQELKQADDLILELRTEINMLEQKILLEQKRDQLQNRFNSQNSIYEKLRDQVRMLEAQASADIKTKIEEFNLTYNDLMINALNNCRSAAIGFDDYMPIVDGGMYKEASASVAIRMMYFFTLLKLSLDNKDVKYPKLLLIDTPETAGVDTENLKHALSQLSKVVADHSQDEFQVILTTGQNKFPAEFTSSVFLRLSDEEKLLRPVTK